MVTIQIWVEDDLHKIQVPAGSNLRKSLLEAGISPYARATQRLNCGGNGLCATCGVEIIEGVPAPSHWHDRLASQWRYPRLSCQVNVTSPMTIRILTNKVIWGKRLPKKNS